jgi:hypothetical protein
VFPGLLPFFVLFEFMLAFGVVHGVGVLLHPFMQRFFRLPGEAGIALVFGWLSGFPSGSETTVMLRKQKLLSQQQGQRLLALAHMPNPLFLIIVVGVGFYKSAWVGLLILASVWIANLVMANALPPLGKRQSGARRLDDQASMEEITATAVKTYPLYEPGETADHLDHQSTGIDKPGSVPQTDNAKPDGNPSKTSHASVIPMPLAPPVPSPLPTAEQNLFMRAGAAMHAQRMLDGRTLGTTLGDSVTNSVTKLLVVGGLMMFCAVIAGLIQDLLPTVAAWPFLAGILESHLGSFAAAANGPFSHPAGNIALITAIVSFGGLSSHLQVGSTLRGTAFSLWQLAAHRLITSVCAAPLSIALYSIAEKTGLLNPATFDLIKSTPTMAYNLATHPVVGLRELPTLWSFIPFIVACSIVLSLFLVVISTWMARRRA